MTNMVTRCPKCSTSFRITSAQLQSAKGAVRCGSCLHIFKAHDHLTTGEIPAVNPGSQTTAKSKPVATHASRQISQSTTPSRKSDAVQSIKPSSRPSTSTASELPAKKAEIGKPSEPNKSAGMKAISSTGASSSASQEKLVFDQQSINRELILSGDDDFLISDDMDETTDKTDLAHHEFDEFFEIKRLPPHNISLFDREIKIEEPAEDDQADESWAMDLLDDASEDAKLISSREFDETQAQEKSVEEFSFQSENFHTDDDESAQHHHTRFSGHMFSLVDEKSTSEDDASEEIQSQPYVENMLYQEAMSEAKDQSPMRAYDTSRAALLMNIMPEPLIMTSRGKANVSQKRAWMGASAVMVVLLLAQIAWLQFHALNRTQPYRSFYVFVCPFFGCELPALIDRAKIRAYNLVVRNHPDAQNALMVDAIILNNAAFEQPYPDLVLAFSTLDDKPVATRRFTPREYLGGELAGQKFMPQNQPVHLTLELVDPGPEAVNYHVYIPE